MEREMKRDKQQIMEWYGNHSNCRSDNGALVRAMPEAIILAIALLLLPLSLGESVPSNLGSAHNLTWSRMYSFLHVQDVSLNMHNADVCTRNASDADIEHLQRNRAHPVCNATTYAMLKGV
jgi:hypothetical protein